VIGVDFFDEQNHKAVQKIIEDIDIKRSKKALYGVV